MTVHYHNKFGIIEDDGTFVEFRDKDQEKVKWEAWDGKGNFYTWQPTYGQSYEIEGGKEESWTEPEKEYYLGGYTGVKTSRKEYRYLPEKEIKPEKMVVNLKGWSDSINECDYEPNFIPEKEDANPEQESQEELWEEVRNIILDNMLDDEYSYQSMLNDIKIDYYITRKPK